MSPRMSQHGRKRSSHARMHTSLDPINQPAVLKREILAIKCHHCHPMLQCEILAIKSLSGTKLRMSQTDQCGIWWVPWGFTYQILLNPMEYDGFHEVLNIKSIQISSYPKCYGSEVLIIKGWNRKDLTRSIWRSGGGAFINPVLALQQFMPFL